MSLTISEIYKMACLLRDDACDTLSGDDAALKFIMRKDIKETIDAIHPYKISPHPNGGWCTKVNTPLSQNKDKRKLLVAPTKEKLYLKLAEWYGEDINKKTLTLNDLYNEWLQYRKQTVENVNTIQRDEQHYKRYFAGSEFFTRKVSTIKRPELKAFCCSVIKGETTKHSGKNSYTPGQHLTRKEWNSVKSILNGMFDYALDCEYIAANLMNNMKFETSLFRVPEPKKSDTEVFNSEEQAVLISWCEGKFRETSDTAYLLPVLMLYIGPRVGETVALKWDDWINERHLVISKEEFKDRTTREVTVVNHTKTHSNRTIPLSQKAVDVLNTIKENSDGSEWIFSRNGERLTERQANYILEKFASDTGNDRKFTHKLRKTCGSNLYKENGLTSKQCSDILGNSPKVFEDYYLFDTDTDAEIIAKLDKQV